MGFKNNVVTSVKVIGLGIMIFAVAYPLLAGGIGQIWGDRARGSIVSFQGEAVGSRLIGQRFTGPGYFQGRPSSINYDSTRSASANLAPNNPVLEERVAEQLAEMEGRYEGAVPADFVTESASALDPHISPAAAYFQAAYIAQETGIEQEELNALIQEHIQARFLALFGQEVVNVLELNLALREVIDHE